MNILEKSLKSWLFEVVSIWETCTTCVRTLIWLSFTCPIAVLKFLKFDALMDKIQVATSNPPNRPHHFSSLSWINQQVKFLHNCNQIKFNYDEGDCAALFTTSSCWQSHVAQHKNPIEGQRIVFIWTPKAVHTIQRFKANYNWIISIKKKENNRHVVLNHKF